jgi:nucleoid-associated protein YgaU
VLALCGGLGLGSLLGSLLSGDPGDGLHLAGVSSVVVEPGDTLWSIAESVGGGADVRDVVDRIQELNRLEGSTLVPGQVLQLP